jgi:streptomycin 6-kinase
MTDEFIQNALRNGEEGKQWLANIPSTIKKYEDKWHLKVLPPFRLTYNYVAPAIKSDGTKVVLKIGFHGDQEFQTEIEALKIFNGDNIEKLIDVDKDNYVMLIENVLPGVPLSTLEDDDQATKILASVMQKLRKPLPQKHNFTTIAQWKRAIPQYLEKYKNKSGPLPYHLVQRAAELFEHLIATSQTPVLLHGDLHQDNVLSSDRSAWLAIDPKGIAAEPAYETAAMIRNPYEKMRHIDNLEPILTRRINILSEELQLDATRIHQWCLAQTVLSAVWSAETPEKKWTHAIRVAEILNKMKI